jgi:predicted O-methyltransferase YrrM
VSARERLRDWVRACTPHGIIDARRRRNLVERPDALRFAVVAPEIPVRSLVELFPGIEANQVAVPASEIVRVDTMLCPLPELLAIGAICRAVQPRTIFEIGTYTGSTTLIMAFNTAPETRITTLDLEPAARDMHRFGMGVGGFPPFEVGGAFRNGPQARRIEQVFGSSETFNYRPYEGRMDIVFIDADHTYEFVQKDTEAALRLLRPGGVVLWDDYLHRPEHPECSGVTQTVNELARTRPCYQIAGTRLAVWIDARTP